MPENLKSMQRVRDERGRIAFIDLNQFSMFDNAQSSDARASDTDAQAHAKRGRVSLPADIDTELDALGAKCLNRARSRDSIRMAK